MRKSLGTLRQRGISLRYKLLRNTVCRVKGHRKSKYVWGLCNRCYEFYGSISDAEYSLMEKHFEQRALYGPSGILTIAAINAARRATAHNCEGCDTPTTKRVCSNCWGTTDDPMFCRDCNGVCKQLSTCSPMRFVKEAEHE